MSTTELNARAIMTTEVITVQVDDPIQDAAQLLLDARITGAPVIDRWGNAVGVFSLTNAVDSSNNSNENKSTVSDKVLKTPDDESYYSLDLRRGWPPTPLTMKEPLKDKKVGDIMTPRVHSVLDSASVAEVTSYLLDRGIHRLFVRDSDNKLVGIITSMDLLRVFAEVLDGKLITEDRQ